MTERKKTSPPGYISSEEASARLGVSKDRLYQWVAQSRLNAFTVGNAFIFLEADISQFERQPTGRKRQKSPGWRIYKGDVKVFATRITAHILPGRQQQLSEKIQAMQQAGDFVFPGSMARYLFLGNEEGSIIELLIFWKSTEIPGEAAREAQLALFQKAFADVLDWQTASILTTDALTYT